MGSTRVPLAGRWSQGELRGELSRISLASLAESTGLATTGTDSQLQLIAAGLLLSERFSPWRVPGDGDEPASRATCSSVVVCLGLTFSRIVGGIGWCCGGCRSGGLGCA
jgi:hypothetical protein